MRFQLMAILAGFVTSIHAFGTLAPPSSRCSIHDRSSRLSTTRLSSSTAYYVDKYGRLIPFDDGPSQEPPPASSPSHHQDTPAASDNHNVIVTAESHTVAASPPEEVQPVAVAQEVTLNDVQDDNDTDLTVAELINVKSELENRMKTFRQTTATNNQMEPSYVTYLEEQLTAKVNHAIQIAKAKQQLQAQYEASLQEAENHLLQLEQDADAQLQAAVDKGLLDVLNAKREAAAQLRDKQNELTTLELTLNAMRNDLDDLSMRLKSYETERTSVRKLIRQCVKIIRTRIGNRVPGFRRKKNTNEDVDREIQTLERLSDRVRI